ncbi:MAG TPA: hypothetical protein VFX30_09315 [bacterium]|nr:hypothetical protein [bacterium]
MITTLFQGLLSNFSLRAVSQTQASEAGLATPASGRSSGIDTYSARPLILSALMGVLGGGCVSSAPATHLVDLEEIRRTRGSIYYQCFFFDDGDPAAAEGRIQAEATTLTEQRTVLESEIGSDRIISQATQTYERFLESISGETPNLSAARMLIEELQRSETTLWEMMNNYSRMNSRSVLQRICLDTLHGVEDRPRSVWEFSPPQRYSWLSDPYQTVLRLLRDITERFNGLPGHGEDFQIDYHLDRLDIPTFPMVPMTDLE